VARPFEDIIKDPYVDFVFSDNPSSFWNPLVFAAFYGRSKLLNMFLEQRDVFVRYCLISPFKRLQESSGE